MKKSVKLLWICFFGVIAAFGLCILFINLGFFGYMPSMSELENPSAALASEVIAADGTPMGKFYYSDEDRTACDFKDISPYVINALVATEAERLKRGSTTMKCALLCAFASVTHLKPQGWASAALPPITRITSAFLMSTQWFVIAPRPNVGARPATVGPCQTRA